MNVTHVARSVVISSHNGPAALRDCLSGLARGLDDESEVIVSAHFLAGEADELRRWAGDRNLPIGIIEAPEATDVPHLRVAGMRAARGDIVLSTEDHLVPDPSWIQASNPGNPVTAGAIEFGSGTAFERALYLFEYGAFMPPLLDGGSPSGANVVYTRDALALLQPRYESYEWEHAWHDFLLEQGCHFSASNEMRLRWCHKGTLSKFLRTARLHGRNYGARRQFSSGLRRLIQVVVLPAMPFLLAGKKIAGAISKQPAAAFAWLAATPALLVLYSEWCLGEGQGYLTGTTQRDTGWRE